MRGSIPGTRFPQVIAMIGLASALTARPAHADEARWRALADGDAFILVGFANGSQLYSLHAGVRPPSSPWAFTLGFFGGWLPGFYVDLIDAANGDDNDDFEVREDGVAVRALHLPPGRTNGFFYGTHVGGSRWTRYHPGSGGEARSNQVFLWPLAGYRWFPGGSAFYLTAWVGPGLLSPGFAESHHGPRAPSFDEPRWLPFAAVHAGFEL